MHAERGVTLIELVAVIAVAAVLSAVAVPGAARVRPAVSGAEGAGRLALVLRAAQALAQSSGGPVRVVVGLARDYAVTDPAGEVVTRGDLGVDTSSTYPNGTLEFSARGWAGLPGTSSPRAGHFSIVGSPHTVVVQLSGCVRWS